MSATSEETVSRKAFEALTERYARQVELATQTARNLAEVKDGAELAALKRELDELKLKLNWQEKRIAWLQKPLIVRAYLKIFGSE